MEKPAEGDPETPEGCVTSSESMAQKVWERQPSMLNMVHPAKFGGRDSRFPAKRRFQSGKHRRNHHGRSMQQVAAGLDSMGESLLTSHVQTYEAKNPCRMLHGPGITCISPGFMWPFFTESYRPLYYSVIIPYKNPITHTIP